MWIVVSRVEIQGNFLVSIAKPLDINLRLWADTHGSEIVVGLVVGLVVAAVVWLTGRPIAYWQRRQAISDKEKQDQEAKTAARKALREEIDSNLAQLQSLLEDLEKPQQGLDRRPADEVLLGAIRLASMEVPIRWRRSVWEDRSVQVSASLTDEEFSAVSSFYRNLSRLDVLKESIGQPWKTMANNWNLYDDGRRAWAEWQGVAYSLDVNGNPLPLNELDYGL